MVPLISINLVAQNVLMETSGDFCRIFTGPFPLQKRTLAGQNIQRDVEENW